MAPIPLRVLTVGPDVTVIELKALLELNLNYNVEGVGFYIVHNDKVRIFLLFILPYMTPLYSFLPHLACLF